MFLHVHWLLWIVISLGNNFRYTLLIFCDVSNHELPRRSFWQAKSNITLWSRNSQINLRNHISKHMFYVCSVFQMGLNWKILYSFTLIIVNYSFQKTSIWQNLTMQIVAYLRGKIYHEANWSNHRCLLDKQISKFCWT